METFSDDVMYIICKNNLEHLLPLKMAFIKKNPKNYKKSTRAVTTKKFSQLTKYQIQKLYNIYRLDFELFEYNLHEYD